MYQDQSIKSFLTQIPKEAAFCIEFNNIPVKFIKSKDNLDDFLLEINSFLQYNKFSEEDCQLPYVTKSDEDFTVILYISNQTQKFHLAKNGILKFVILSNFKELTLCAYVKQHSKKFYIFDKLIGFQQSKYQDEQILQSFSNQNQNDNFSQNGELIMDKINNFIQSNKFKFLISRKVEHQEVSNLLLNYPIRFQLNGIFYYYNENNSCIIPLNLNQDFQIYQNNILRHFSKFDQILYSTDISVIILQKENTFDLCNWNIIQFQDQVKYLNEQNKPSLIFGESKCHVKTLGYSKKSDFEQIETIPNKRLREDLLEMFQCLSDDLEFDKQYLEQPYFVYYNQSEDPYLLQGLIIGPKNSFYEYIPYNLSIRINKDYPKSPPRIIFSQKIFHPNVNEFGEIHIDILQSKYNSNVTLKDILMKIVDSLIIYDSENICNPFAYYLFSENFELYIQQVELAIIYEKEILNQINTSRLIEEQVYNLKNERQNQIKILKQEKFINEDQISCDSQEVASNENRRLNEMNSRNIPKQEFISEDLSFKEFKHKAKNNYKYNDYQILIDMTADYETHDTSIPNVSFHYNSDGSKAILLNSKCEEHIAKKVLNQRDWFDNVYYDENETYMLLQIKSQQYKGDFDAKQQLYNNSSLPLNSYLCSIFEQSKKNIKIFGYEKKNQLKLIKTIANTRLRLDLIDLFECLDQNLEYNQQYQNQNFYAYYTQSDNPNLLEGLIIGPEETPYEGIAYTLTIEVPKNYPDVPPKIIFNQQILHPNISEEGKICLDILQEKWSPVLTIQKVLISIISLLFEKGLDDVYNHYAKCLYIKDPLELKKQNLKQAIISGCSKLEINEKDNYLFSKQGKNNLPQQLNVKVVEHYENDENENEYDDYEYEYEEEECKEDE